ncbi:MAG: hypothetical protein R2851_02050 [Caldilineaceae bacterium]
MTARPPSPQWSNTMRHTDLDVIAITDHDVIDGALEALTWPALRHSGGARHRDQHTGRRSARAINSHPAACPCWKP